MHISETTLETRGTRAIDNVRKVATGRLAEQAVTILAAFLIARIMLPETYGRFAGIMALVAMLAPFSQLGLPMVGARFLTPLWQKQDKTEAVTLGTTIWSVRVVCAILTGFVVSLWLLLTPQLGLPLLGGLVVFVLASARYANDGNHRLLLPIGRPGAMAIHGLATQILRLGAILWAYNIGGLTGALMGIGGVYVLSFTLSSRVLKYSGLLKLSHFRLASLRQHVHFSSLTFLANFINRAQKRVGVYILAGWLAPTQAAFLGITLQVYSMIDLLLGSLRRALTPILAEVQDEGNSEQLRFYAENMLRLAAIGGTLSALSWAFLGRFCISVVLTERYATTYPCLVVLTSAVGFLAAGGFQMTLLYTRERPGIVFLSQAIHAAVILLGIWIATRVGPTQTLALRISVAYAFGAAIFFTSGIFLLRRSANLFVPLKRPLLLLLPALVAPLMLNWDPPVLVALAVLGLALALYAVYAIKLKLLTPEEIRMSFRVLQRGDSRP